MNPLSVNLEKYSSLVFWETSKTSLSYFDFAKNVREQKCEFPERSLIGVASKDPLEMLIKVFALWEKNCVPVLINHNLNDEQTKSLKKVVPFTLYDENPSAHKINFCEEGDLIFFTSGSGGSPKGIVHSTNTLFESARATGRYYNLKEGDVWGLTLPFHHAGGFMIALRALVSGARVHHAASWREVVSKPCDFYSLVPAQLQEGLELNSLKQAKVVLIGGAPLSQSLLEKANKESIPLYLSYGMSETAAGITGTQMNPLFADDSGSPLPGSSIEIAESGKIKIKSNSLAIGQYLDGNFEKLPLEKNWFVQNDFGVLSNNHLKVLGRSDNIFLSGGENIDPKEIEKELLSFQDIKNVFVRPISDEKFTHVALALVETHREDLSDLKLNLKEKLPAHLVPKAILPFRWDYTNSLKPTKERLDLLTHLFEIGKTSPFHFEWGGTLNKPLCLFFHGFMGKGSDWDPITEKIKADIFYVKIDLPGHGKTKAKDFKDQDDLLTKLHLLLKHFESFWPTGIGYSMGGRILLQYIQSFGDTFDKIFLESTHPGFNNSLEREKRLADDENLLRAIETPKHLKDFLSHWYELPLFQGIKKNPAFENLILSKEENDPAELKKALKLMSTGHQKSALPFLSNYKKPLVYLTGSNDEKYVSFSKEIASIENKKITCMEVLDCSHNTHFQCPDFFARILLERLIPCP